MSTPSCLDFRNTNSLWSSVIVETLVRCGVKMAVVSPGSRSTPLTMALAAHSGIRAVPVLDERSAAFLALGAAKRSGLPVVLVCTSGTAGANYLPAVIEAHESGTPLVVITADRPPEMRDCASGQTIDQGKLFGSFVTFFHELAVPEGTPGMLAYVRQTVAHAVERSLGRAGGPAHLNAPFRDPLPPVEDGSVVALKDAIGADFFDHLKPPSKPETSSVKAWQRATTERGLIVAGPANPADPVSYVAAVRRLAANLGWPVLADALSPLRHHAVGEEAVIVVNYDAILRSERAAGALVPRHVLCLEVWPTSKVLRAWIERSGAEVVLVAETPNNRDALHGRTRHLSVGVEALVAECSRVDGSAYAQAWRKADLAVATELEAQFSSLEAMFESKLAWSLARCLPDDADLFVASSMPVRDAEWFWPATGGRCRFHFNRGANGIDGTLSSAIGVAEAGGRAFLLTGDLALLHDTNGFLLHHQMKGSLTVVLVNNRGGGIFGHLPVAQFEGPFETYFATPQNVDFGALCSAYGVDHVMVRGWSALAPAVSGPSQPGIKVVEIPTDRRADVGRRKALFRALSDVAGQTIA